MGGDCRFAGAALLTKQGNRFHGVSGLYWYSGLLDYGYTASRAQIRQGALCGSIEPIRIKLRLPVCSLPYSGWPAVRQVIRLIELNREKVIVLIGVIIRG